VPVDTFEPGYTIAPVGVARILCARSLAQFRDAIIRGISVAMIDFSGGVLAVNIEPSEPMGVMRHPVNIDLPVAVASPSACFCARGNAPLR
jgi:hypothetical protein